MRAERKAVLAGAVTGTVIGFAIWVLFGVLDVQCRNDERGPNWNAETQECEP